jgi:LAO/AO transport system kinase
VSATRRGVDVGELVQRARTADARAVARLISLVENGGPSGGGGVAAGGDAPVLREVAAALAPYGGHAQVVGLTGSPGVGKSTSTSAMVTALRAAGKRVGVLAVDPSSPFSGGALLGDRVRMQDHATDDGVFIRSMAARGQLGGLSAAVPQALRVLDAAGCDVVLIETVGVGQAEVEIASLADTTIVLLAPGMGDGIQAAKAGILEIADIFVVNKADRDGADQVARDLRYMLSLGGRHSDAGAWRPPIVKTIASRGEGIDDVVAAIAKHHDWMQRHGVLDRRRQARAASEIEAIAVGEVRARFAQVHGSAALDAAAARVAAGDADPYTAADELIASL